MLFNSVNFAFFFTIVFIVYWFMFKSDLKKQNVFLFAASYFFYACWDCRFLFLLAFSTFLDYYSGLKIYRSESKKQRKIWLVISLIVNLGLLGFFKYFNFFVESFADVEKSIGLTPHYSSLNIILPVGISFYTFHGLSYVFDIYYKRIQPTTNWINYTLFVSFFPLLVAGPIERATHLLPQVEKVRVFDYKTAVDGLRQVLWGLFKKIVIADNCAVNANEIFNNSASYSGSTLLFGALFFTFQIYCDFSGYTDMAKGTARLLGFDLLQNFKFPYFSRSIAEFWRRWHISLSSWFRDYLYIPLGGSKGSIWSRIRNTFIIFLVSGFWHGANWTFIVWGGVNALFILPSIIFKSNRTNLNVVAQGKGFPNKRELLQMLVTFFLTVLAWIFFRAENLSHAFKYFSGIFSTSLFQLPEVFPGPLFILLAVFMIIEWAGRENNYAIEKLFFKSPVYIRWGFYFGLVMITFLFSGQEQQFIYFQF